MKNVKVKVKMQIIVEQNGESIFDMKEKEFEYEIEKTNQFYLRRIRNFINRSQTAPEAVVKTWKKLAKYIEKVLTDRGIAFDDHIPAK